MKRLYRTQERNYNPSGTPQSSTEYVMERYKDRADHLFISFTKLDKLGINPQSRYDTPLGIYAYPLSYLLRDVNENDPFDMKQSIGYWAPFAGSSPTAWIFEASSSGRFIEDIGNGYSRSDLTKDKEWLLKNKLPEIIGSDEREFPNLVNVLRTLSDMGKQKEADDIVINGINSYVLKDHQLLEQVAMKFMLLWEVQARVDTSGGKLWNITREIAKRLPVKWNALFREMGIIGVADRSGKGVIHQNEKTQAVFFSRKAINLVEKIDNNERKVDMKKLNAEAIYDIKCFEKVLDDFIFNDVVIQIDQWEYPWKNIYDILKEWPVRDFANVIFGLYDRMLANVYRELKEKNDLSKEMKKRAVVAIEHLYAVWGEITKSKDMNSLPFLKVHNFFDKHLKPTSEFYVKRINGLS